MVGRVAIRGLRRAARSFVGRVVLVGVTAFLAPPTVDYLLPLLHGAWHSGRGWPGYVTAYGTGGWRVKVTYHDSDSRRSVGIVIRIDNLRQGPAPNLSS